MIALYWYDESFNSLEILQQQLHVQYVMACAAEAELKQWPWTLTITICHYPSVYCDISNCDLVLTLFWPCSQTLFLALWRSLLLMPEKGAELQHVSFPLFMMNHTLFQTLQWSICAKVFKYECRQQVVSRWATVPRHFFLIALWICRH